MEKIDHHVHLGTDRNRTGFSQSSKQLISLMNQYCIDRAIVFACPNIGPQDVNPYKLENDMILQASNESSRLIPFMFVHPFRDEMKYLEENEKYFAGFKVHSHAKYMKYTYPEAIQQKQLQFILDSKKSLCSFQNSSTTLNATAKGKSASFKRES